MMKWSTGLEWSDLQAPGKPGAFFMGFQKRGNTERECGRNGAEGSAYITRSDQSMISPVTTLNA